MASVHFLDVSPGDCTIIRHASERVSMIDICDGNIDENHVLQARVLQELISPRGDFGMREYPTNPITYVRSLGISGVFRFILTHPDMDHMDGLNALVDRIGIVNFWSTGVTRVRPEFSRGSPYDEADWNRYELLRAGSEPGVTSIRALAESRFTFANLAEGGSAGGDGLYILAPNAELVRAASRGDINDGAYVLLYCSQGGRVLIPGDAHDATWEYVLKHHAADVAGCSC
jgi:competence protein ComEC